MHPVVKDMKKAEAILAWAVDKMEERYDLLQPGPRRGTSPATTSCRSRRSCAASTRTTRRNAQRSRDQMPYIVIVIDEVADLMMQMKKEVEGHIIRLAQKSRAAGIHLVLATQKPTVDVITGLIKSNLPARICFQVASRSDSRGGARRDGGRQAARQGRHALPAAGHEHDRPRPGRVRRATRRSSASSNAIETDEPCYDSELLKLKTREQMPSGGDGGELGEKLRERDALYEQAVEIVVRERRGSVSLLAAGARHRLRPGGAADRLHGRGRHRRRLQRQQRPRGAVHARAVGGAEEGGGVMDGEIVTGSSGRQVATSSRKPVRSA